MTDKLRAAAQAAINVLFRAGEELRWQSIGQAERDLRAALAEPEVQSTHSDDCYKWHHGCAIARIEAALKEKNNHDSR